jgi:hypothetical protein
MSPIITTPLVSALLLLSSLFSPNVFADPAEEDAIRHVISSEWSKPEAQVEVNPVITSDEYAMAGWTQNERGGRALLKKTHGQWMVLFCGGEKLTEQAELHKLGIPAEIASQLLLKLNAAEKNVSSQRRERFSSFEGVVPVSGSQHAHH